MKTVILGGGISGLLAAHVFRGPDTTLIERSQLGGTYLDGGLRYIRYTASMGKILDELSVPWCVEKPRGAILVGGKLYNHPKYIRELPEQARLAFQMAHWRKTRGEITGFTDTCMNDPMGEGDALSINTNHRALIVALIESAASSGVNVVARSVQSVTPFRVIHEDNSVLYDRLVTTLPLRVAREVFHSVSIPEAKACPLTVARVKSLPQGLISEGAHRYDYIYTCDWLRAHRISKHKDGWDVEMNGQWQEPELVEPALREVGSFATKLTTGHIIPLRRQVEWPENTLPLGRFAEWNSRSTVEKSLDRLLAWAEKS